MNKNFKIITINGIRGLILAIFIVFGLIAGFIVSPSWVCMKLWNIFIVKYFPISSMNIFQGLLLWCSIALTIHALNGKKSFIGFGAYPTLTKAQIQDIMEKAKTSDSKIFNEIDPLKEVLKKENNTKINNEQKKDIEKNEEIRG